MFLLFFFNSLIGKCTLNVSTFCNFRGKDRSGLVGIPNFVPLLINPGYIITPQGHTQKSLILAVVTARLWFIWLIHFFFFFYAHILHNTSHQVNGFAGMFPETVPHQALLNFCFKTKDKCRTLRWALIIDVIDLAIYQCNYRPLSE